MNRITKRNKNKVKTVNKIDYKEEVFSNKYNFLLIIHHIYKRKNCLT